MSPLFGGRHVFGWKWHRIAQTLVARPSCQRPIAGIQVNGRGGPVMFAHGRAASQCGFVSLFSCPLLLDVWFFLLLPPHTDIFVGCSLFESTLVMMTGGRSGPRERWCLLESWREGEDWAARQSPGHQPRPGNGDETPPMIPAPNWFLSSQGLNPYLC